MKSLEEINCNRKKKERKSSLSQPFLWGFSISHFNFSNKKNRFHTTKIKIEVTIFRNNKLFSSFFKAPDLKHLFLNNHTSLTHTQAGYAVFIQTQKLTHTPVCFGSSRGGAGGGVGFVVCHNIRFLCITVYKLRFYGSFNFLSYYTIVFSSSPIFV